MAKNEITIIDREDPNIERLPRLIIYSNGVESYYLRPNQNDPFNSGKFYYPCVAKEYSPLIYKYLETLENIGKNDFKL